MTFAGYCPVAAMRWDEELTDLGDHHAQSRLKPFAELASRRMCLMLFDVGLYTVS